MPSYVLTVASILTRPPVIIMTINAIDIAKFFQRLRFLGWRKSYVNNLLFCAWAFCYVHGLASLVQDEPFSQRTLILILSYQQKEDIPPTDADEETSLDSVS